MDCCQLTILFLDIFFSFHFIFVIVSVEWTAAYCCCSFFFSLFRYLLVCILYSRFSFRSQFSTRIRVLRHFLEYKRTHHERNYESFYQWVSYSSTLDSKLNWINLMNFCISVEKVAEFHASSTTSITYVWRVFLVQQLLDKTTIFSLSLYLSHALSFFP